MTDSQFEEQGMSAYYWPTLYCLVISFEMAYGKKIIRSVDLKTQSGPVLYTNMLGFPPMLLFAYIGGNEYQKFWSSFWLPPNNGVLPPGSVILLVLGCIVGIAIGYSSWWCRDKVSATSFTLIGVMNKCLTVLMNLLIWDNHASALGIASLFLCLVGGTIYRQAPMRNATTSQEEDDNNDGNSKSPFLQTQDGDKGWETDNVSLESGSRLTSRRQE